MRERQRSPLHVEYRVRRARRRLGGAPSVRRDVVTRRLPEDGDVVFTRGQRERPLPIRAPRENRAHVHPERDRRMRVEPREALFGAGGPQRRVRSSRTAGTLAELAVVSARISAYPRGRRRPGRRRRARACSEAPDDCNRRSSSGAPEVSRIRLQAPFASVRHAEACRRSTANVSRSRRSISTFAW